MVSTEAARLAAKRHYRNVMVFLGGIPEWKKAGYPLSKKAKYAKVKAESITSRKLSAMLDDVYLVDLRPEHIYSNGYIPFSRAIPLGHLSSFYTDIPKDETIVVVDHKGKQSPTASKFLKSKGYPKVYWLKGGITAWIKEGYSVEK